MKKLTSVFILSLLISSTALAFAKNNFQFQINSYHTQRQGGQTLDVYVRYAMKDNVPYSQYPDYRDLRKITLVYLEPSKELPVNTYWEIIAAKIGNDLKLRYPLSGVSVQLLVSPNEHGNISEASFEPGFHGPIYTKGDVIPLSQIIPSNMMQK